MLGYCVLPNVSVTRLTAVMVFMPTLYLKKPAAMGIH